MSIDPVEGHFGNWIGVVVWIVLFGLFLAFIPFYKKSHIKPAAPTWPSSWPLRSRCSACR